jgi:hypothetical protein
MKMGERNGLKPATKHIDVAIGKPHSFHFISKPEQYLKAIFCIDLVSAMSKGSR